MLSPLWRLNGERLALLAFCICVCAFAHASSISYTGNLRTDATVKSCGPGCALGASDSDGDYAQYAAVLRNFTLTQSSVVQAVTLSYGGGVNGAGSTIAQGGLEPYLSLFDGGGNFLASTYFETLCPAGAKTNTNSGQCYDVLLDGGTLAAGDYTIALSAYENMSFAENKGVGTLADGFTGLGNLAANEDLHYAFDLNITPSTVSPPVTVTPEPPSTVLAATGFALLAGVLFTRGRSKTVTQ